MEGILSWVPLEYIPVTERISHEVGALLAIRVALKQGQRAVMPRVHQGQYFIDHGTYPVVLKSDKRIVQLEMR
jgi:5-formyltetrahydrofolate cyclo-ligase